MTLAPRFQCLHYARVILAVIVFSQSGCKDRAGSDGPMPQPTKSPPSGFSVDTGAALAPDPSKLDVKVWSDSKVKQLKAKLPRFTSTELLVPVALLPHSQITHLTLCINTAIAIATKDLSTRFVSRQWNNLDFPTLQHKDKRKIFNAENPPFRVNALLSPGQMKGCADGDKQTKAYLTFTLINAPDKKPNTVDTKDAGTPKAKKTKGDGGGQIPMKLLHTKAIGAKRLAPPVQKEAPRDGGISGRVPPRTR